MCGAQDIAAADLLAACSAVPNVGPRDANAQSWKRLFGSPGRLRPIAAKISSASPTTELNVQNEDVAAPKPRSN